MFKHEKKKITKAILDNCFSALNRIAEENNIYNEKINFQDRIGYHNKKGDFFDIQSLRIIKKNKIRVRINDELFKLEDLSMMPLTIIQHRMEEFKIQFNN